MADKNKDKDKDKDKDRDDPKGKGAGHEAGDGEAGAEGEGEGEGKKPGLDAKKIVLFIVLPLFLLIGAGAGLYFTGVLDGLLGKKAATEQQAAEGGKGGDENAETAVVPSAFFLKIPDMLVNLSSADGQTRYLRLSVQLELSSQSDMKAVEAVMPRVVDQFQTYLRELRVKDLRGSQGIYRLQTELLSRVNAAAYPVEVKDVLFQEILIQ